jgi:subtilisin-like proprotein convertase family protein
MGNGGGTILDWSVDLSAMDRAPVLQSVTRSSTGAPVGIGSGAPSVVSSTINNFPAMPGNYIHRVTVRTDLHHTFPGDIDMTLTSPFGRTVTLTTDNGGSADDAFYGTVWRDDVDPDGALPYSTNPGLVTDEVYAVGVSEPTLVPEEGLGSFSAGSDPSGNWQLTISDDSSGDGGALDGWSLTVTTAGCSRPDARIRVGAAGPLAGNDTYNATGQGQSRTASAPRGGSVTFRIPVQNDASVRERLRLSGAGSAAAFGVVYRAPDGRDITAGVRAGTFRTPRLEPGATYLVRAVVTVKTNAPAGARLTRKLTASSPINATVRDTVSFTTRRS